MQSPRRNHCVHGIKEGKKRESIRLVFKENKKTHQIFTFFATNNTTINATPRQAAAILAATRSVDDKTSTIPQNEDPRSISYNARPNTSYVRYCLR